MKKFSMILRYVAVVLAIVFAVCAMSGCSKKEYGGYYEVPIGADDSGDITYHDGDEDDDDDRNDGDDDDAQQATQRPTAEPITPDYSSGRQQAQNFTVKDKDGKELELASLIGKPIVVTFFATWIDDADDAIEDLQEVYEKYGNDCHFLIITAPDGYNETIENITEFMKDEKITVPVYFDTDSAVYDLYGITGVPQVYYIDSQGMIAGISSNLGVPETMGARIEMLLSE